MRRELRQKAIELFERAYLPRASEPGVEKTIESSLDRKVAKIERRSGEAEGHLVRAVRQARLLWRHRHRLERKHVLYLAAALLYLVSPVDLIPDPIPAIGLSDDLVVLTRALVLILAAVGVARDILKEGALEAIQEAEAAAETVVPRSVAAVTIGLWGATTAAAVSLAVSASTGRLETEWALYASVVASLVAAWNLGAAVRFVRRFRELDGTLRERLFRAFASRITLRHLAVLGVPLFLLITLAIARVLGGFAR